MGNRPALVVALAGLVALVGCSSDDTPTGPVITEPSLIMTLVACPYHFVDGGPIADTGTMEVTVPGQVVCDTVTGGLTSTNDTTVFVYYWFPSFDTLYLSIKQLSPLIRVMTAGPSFSTDIGEFLDYLDTLRQVPAELVLAMLVLVRPDSGSAVQGLWRFAGFLPIIQWYIESELDSSQQEAIKDLIADDDGQPSLLFEFTASELLGMISRQAYGRGAMVNIVDTLTFDVSVVFAEEEDSVWALAGLMSGDTVYAAIDSRGNIEYSHSDSVSYAGHTYYVEPQQCPNLVAPFWWQTFLDQNTP